LRLVEREASAMMLAAITGYADSLWRQSTWYLTILEDLPPKADQAKMEKMEKIVVRMRKLLYIPSDVQGDIRRISFLNECSGKIKKTKFKTI
jgi:hypothetical protein